MGHGYLIKEKRSVDIIDEVVEEVQHEKLLNLWKKYSIFVYVFLSLIVLGTALYAFWKEHKSRELHHVSEVYIDALELEQQNKIDQSQILFRDVINANIRGFSALAELSLSDMMVAYDKEKAREELLQLASSSNSPKSLKNLALVKSVLLDIDEISPDLLKERLGALLTDDNNPWSSLAIEFKAALEYREGNLAKSYALYDTLVKNPNISPGIRSRSLKMIMILKSKGADAL